MARTFSRTFRIQEYEHFQQQLADNNIVGQTVLYDIRNTNVSKINVRGCQVSEVKQYDDDDDDDEDNDYI